MRLTVLGASPSMPNPGGAGSGYLVRASGSSLLMDCGPGVVGRLRAQLDVAELGGLIISHLHPDHFIDLISLRYGVKYAAWRPSGGLCVYLPPDGRRFLAGLGRAIDGDPRFFEVLELAEYAPQQELRVNNLSVRPVPVQHYVPSHALVVVAEERQLTYSADAAPCRGLIEAARGANLFLCEATLRSGADDEPRPEKRGHVGADEAGAMAREAGAERLLLTHYPANHAAQRLAAARRTFGPRVGLAREGRTYPV